MKILKTLTILVLAGGFSSAFAQTMEFPIVDGESQVYQSSTPAFMGVCRLTVVRTGEVFTYFADVNVRRPFQGSFLSEAGPLSLIIGDPKRPSAMMKIQFREVGGAIQPASYEFAERIQNGSRLMEAPPCNNLRPVR